MLAVSSVSPAVALSCRTCRDAAVAPMDRGVRAPCGWVEVRGTFSKAEAALGGTRADEVVGVRQLREAGGEEGVEEGGLDGAPLRRRRPGQRLRRRLAEKVGAGGAGQRRPHAAARRRHLQVEGVEPPLL